MSTLRQYLAELVRQRNQFADNLTQQGVPAAHTEKLNTLVPKVLDISGGSTGPSGTIRITQNGMHNVRDFAMADVDVAAVPDLIAKTITQNGTYWAGDDGADGYSEITVHTELPFQTPLDFDLMCGYVSSGTWVPYSTPPGDTCVDQYYLRTGKHYLIFLGESVGNRFRAGYFRNDVKTYTTSTGGVNVQHADNPSPYAACPVFSPSYDGYLVIGKSNQLVTGIHTYVIALEDLI